MNMSPKVRPLWLRLLLMFGTACCGRTRHCTCRGSFCRATIKSVVNNWTHEMFWILIKSRFTQASIDQTVLLQDADLVQAEGPGGAASIS